VKPEDLKNYDKSWPEVVSSPEFNAQLGRVSASLRRELRRDLGWVDTLRVVWRTRRELRKMSGHDWSSMEARGTSRSVIDGLKMPAAAVKALSAVVGPVRAAQIYKRALDEQLFPVLASAFPTLEDFCACGEDPFAAVRTYMRAMVAADSRNGFHTAEIVEDSDKVFAYNITYCAQCQMAEEFGDRELCYPRNCYGDEVFLPRVLEGTGVVFRRTGTLATGAKVCDFRFEKVDGAPAPKLHQIRARRTGD
jgi:L-2-amino-thiazoline-4-carboxylic acid hydrolase